MSLRINNNAAAMTAHRNLSGSDSALNKSIERLSSGYKINSAGDDPAGLVISEKLRAQVSGLGQAISNAGDAVNMVKTAEGALNEVNKLLRSMRDLAVHAANSGANDSAAIQADQAQIRSALQSINKISSETQFGNKKLLDGSAGLTASITGSSVVAVNLSSASISTDLTGISIDVKTAAAKATTTGTALINVDNSNNSITINGVQITGGVDEASTIDAINAKSNETGVVASATAGHLLVLTQQEYGSDKKIAVSSGTALYGAATAAAVGTDVRAEVTTNGTTAGLTDTGSNGMWDHGTGTTLKDSLGNAIQLTDAAAGAVADVGAQFNVAAGTLNFQVGAYAGQTRQMNIASVASDQLGLTASSTFTDLSQIDVTTDAQESIKVLDKAISDISTQRANMGAVQKNVLESSINSLTVAQENISASESSIRDTDMASEMVSFTKSQILEQAGVSMLAQANQAPQQLLKLLG